MLRETDKQNLLTVTQTIKLHELLITEAIMRSPISGQFKKRFLLNLESVGVQLASLFIHIFFIEQQKTKISALCFELLLCFSSKSKLKLALCSICLDVDGGKKVAMGSFVKSQRADSSTF